MKSSKINLSGFNWNIVFWSILLFAMLAFELVNFSSTEYSLNYFLGGITLWGIIKWSTLFAVAFCAADIGGIAKIFTPEGPGEEPRWTVYVLIAWVLAALLNLFFTVWGIGLAMAQAGVQGNEMISRATLMTWVPIVIAVMVFIIRLTLVGTFTSILNVKTAKKKPDTPKPEVSNKPNQPNTHINQQPYRPGTYGVNSPPPSKQPVRPNDY